MLRRGTGAKRKNMRHCVIGFWTITSFLGASGLYAESPTAVAVAGPPALQLSNFDLAPLGYTTDEFFVSGTASSYKLSGAPTPESLNAGRWNAVPSEPIPYTTRIVTVRPSDPKKFNGTVVVEWLNVSSGIDAAADWIGLHREILRNGYAYVAVSAQKVGVEGGPGLSGVGNFLKKANPERYGRLNHPGDSFSYDMFSQAGSVIREPGKVLAPLVPRRVIAVGESQSAVFLTTYVNAIDPLAKVYDGFLIHSRFGSSATLENASMMPSAALPRYIQFRPDLRVPVITIITETDLLDDNFPGYHGARQPDNDRLRVWEIAGTSHADSYMFTVSSIDSGSASLDKLAEAYAPTTKILGADLAKPANNAPQHHYVAEAALWNLDRWIRTGQAPAKVMPMELREAQTGARVSFALDANGLVEGGIRTPWVDVPAARLSGKPNSGGPLGFLVGSCEPFDQATLDRLYPGGKKEYLKKFDASLESAIKAGFILPADKREILDLAAITYRGR
jgi:hypothetical protein